MMTDSVSTVVNWRRTTAEQALYYLEHRDRFLAQYTGQYILLQDGEVRWHNTSSDLRASRRKLARNKHSHAMWLSTSIQRRPRASITRCTSRPWHGSWKQGCNP